MENWLEQHKRVLSLILVAIAVVGLVLFQALRPEPLPIILNTAVPSPSPEASPTPRPLRVYVSGAVHHSDVYALGPDCIIKDALLAAGGATDDADLDRINLALPLVDGQHIYVPRLGEEDMPVELPARQGATVELVNINTADLAALESLPGIGPVMAQRILDYRQAHGPFTRIDDIVDVAGIGSATFEKIRDLITTE